MTGIPESFDIINKDRFLDIIYGESELQLGVTTGTLDGEPCELLVMITEEIDEDDITVVPLARFIGEEDLSRLDIPYAAPVEVIEWQNGDEEEEIDLESFKPKGPLH